jgi:hypothetical protein
MFPSVGFQILTEPGSREDFHVMEAKNLSRDELSVAGFRDGARGKWKLIGVYAREAFQPGSFSGCRPGSGFGQAR